MRTAIVVIVLAAIAGTATGVGMNFASLGKMVRTAPIPPSPEEMANDPRLPPLPPAAGPQPRVAVDETHHDFGVMQRDAHQSHVFIFRNEGGYDLILKKGDVTCKCTMSSLAEKPIPPGGSAEVLLTWEARGDSSEFRQEAEILTNDPSRPRVLLTITGKIQANVSAMPPSLNFSSLLSTETRSAEVRVVSPSQTNFAILEHAWKLPDSIDHLRVAIEPMPPDELKSLDVAAGFKVVVTIDPGLPAGTLLQALVLKTNVADAPPLEVPLLATIASDVSVVGRGWRSLGVNRGILSFGTVDREKGAERELKIMVRGDKRHSLHFRVTSVRPAALSATLDEPTSLNDDTVVQIPLRIAVAAHGPGFRLLGRKGDDGQWIESELAEVVIESDDPSVGTLKILVQIAVGAS